MPTCYQMATLPRRCISIFYLSLSWNLQRLSVFVTTRFAKVELRQLMDNPTPSFVTGIPPLWQILWIQNSCRLAIICRFDFTFDCWCSYQAFVKVELAKIPNCDRAMVNSGFKRVGLLKELDCACTYMEFRLWGVSQTWILHWQIMHLDAFSTFVGGCTLAHKIELKQDWCWTRMLEQIGQLYGVIVFR